MTQEFSLEAVDVDGAIRETAQQATEALEVEGDTRATFFKKAGLAGGALMGGGALLGIFGAGTALASGRPPSSFGSGDIGILNFALTLEYLEAHFYNGTRGIESKPAKAILKAVRRHENEHVDFLQKALGSNAVAKPKFDFHGTNHGERVWLATAFKLENEGVHAYSGQAPNISNPAYLKAALSIATVEARHAGAIGLIHKMDSKGISPNGPFDKPYSGDHVLRDVKHTHFIKG